MIVVKLPFMLPIRLSIHFVSNNVLIKYKRTYVGCSLDGKNKSGFRYSGVGCYVLTHGDGQHGFISRDTQKFPTFFFAISCPFYFYCLSLCPLFCYPRWSVTAPCTAVLVLQDREAGKTLDFCFLLLSFMPIPGTNFVYLSAKKMINEGKNGDRKGINKKHAI